MTLSEKNWRSGEGAVDGLADGGGGINKLSNPGAPKRSVFSPYATPSPFSSRLLHSGSSSRVLGFFGDKLADF